MVEEGRRRRFALFTHRAGLRLCVHLTVTLLVLAARISRDWRWMLQSGDLTTLVIDVLRYLAGLCPQPIKLRGSRLGPLAPPFEVILRQLRFTIRTNRSGTE